MKIIALLAVMTFVSGCGPDRALLMDTKFDAPLRQKMASLTTAEQSEALLVMGSCAEMINGAMRQELIDAGAEVLSMNGDLFTARVSSDDLFSLAALEFVTHLQLSQTIKPHSR